MPTLLQLQSERWWNDEVVPPAVDWLGDQLCTETGRPRSAFGCKGDTLHMRGSHRSQAWLLNSRYATNRTYTVQSGLTVEQSNWCSGVDFTPGSPTRMIQQCKRIDSALRAGVLEEVREFYGNLDGDKIVDGWDNIANRAATSDSSHLWHWHLTLDRRYANTQSIMARILHIVLGDAMTLSTAQETKLVNDTTQTRSLLHDGKRGGGLAETSGGVPIAWIVRQFSEVHAKLDSTLRQVGALTVEMANLKAEVLAIKAAVDAIPTTGTATVSLDPMALSGELRFGTPPA